MHNRTVALKLFYRYGNLTRPQLSRLMSLRRSSAANIVREFMDQGLVQLQNPDGKSGPGRQNLLEINAAWGHAVGVGLGREEVALSATDARGGVLAVESHPRPLSTSDLGALVKDFSVRQVACGAASGRLLAVGASVSGIVDARQGIVRQSYELGFHDEPLAEHLQAAVEVPVYIDNDVVLATTAEADSRRAQEQSDFIYLYPNFMRQNDTYMIWGMGSCLFLNGKLRRGSHAAAGELFRLPLPGPSISFSKTDWDLLQSQDGEPSPRLVQVAKWIAPQLAFPVSLIDPREIVMGGPLRWRNRALLQLLEQDLNAHLMPIADRYVRINAAGVEQEPAVLAARMAREQRVRELVVES
jgi:predicted NBD/HSP70 family sugar kinase